MLSSYEVEMARRWMNASDREREGTSPAMQEYYGRLADTLLAIERAKEAARKREKQAKPSLQPESPEVAPRKRHRMPVRRPEKPVERDWIAVNTPRPEKVFRACARLYGYSKKELTGKSRVHHVVVVRQAAMYVLRSAGLSLCQIGRIFSRDHTTVFYGIRKVESSDELKRVADRIALIAGLPGERADPV